ncbi:Exc2 family lipoprotein [Salmonella enterica subsp. enterica]|uniref:Exc2 family lipoprotein n=1 Tax=Salmonella enterica TaxID=28901 RepID=UPI0003BCA169|nr:Exc2 family lipoprotein [Salmonella enterica]EBY9433385.1 entry exclusion protein 2 [Salmonella enterica subsp. enterica serovar Cerro]ESG76348.1 putative entry exclusion protein 2 [Salmonella enterica subsp. enterica serovar Muenchen str. baa1594]EBI1927244.1 Exc2 family lipoprotein [Salmonella enterica]EEO3522726.1 Exc2 family lipoprotein [Salmonella enterica subsp. enterica serovar Cerro]
MKKPSAVLLSTLLGTVLLTVACTPKMSVEHHARHYVYASDDRSDPNFYTNKADTTRMMVPFFQQFREMGVKDRTAGVSEAAAQQRVKEFHSEKFLNSLQGTTTFAGRKYANSDTPSSKKLNVLADTISAVYLDGYAGRP